MFYLDTTFRQPVRVSFNWDQICLVFMLMTFDVRMISICEWGEGRDTESPIFQ